MEFDKWAESLESKTIILNDLLFEHNHTLFQIDSLFICADTIYLFEVKYYEGDFYLDGDRWYTSAGKEVKNPLHQLQRAEISFKKLLHEYGYNLSIMSHLMFMHSDFFLFQAPFKTPITFPSQLNRFKNTLNKQLTELKNSDVKLAEKLLSLQSTKVPDYKLPDYNYERLRKGITCPECNEFYEALTNSSFFCHQCGGRESCHDAVLRSTAEFKLLFPEHKVTTAQIYDWCRVVRSKKSVRRILLNNFKPMGSRKTFYFV
ncbi:nuclease-related domain-containing protein [Bacillus sp. AK031]